ncbi:glycosyltransferase family 29 protein [Salinimicrobium flavum]|uniref:Glycosyltransferase family 29 protein n=1 Tax=Salinimicrobium flavum TaxID=1737065 RepID=A0ABW5IYP9_9FLAO
MNKLINFFKGIPFFFQGIKVFHPKISFSGKRVAIVGPADSAYEMENGSYIDGFDYVIRINKAISTWKHENEKYIGTRTDLWFHSFFENEKSGGGKLNPEIIIERGVNTLVNPRSTFQAYRRTFNFYRKYKHTIPVYHLSDNVYRALKKEFPDNLRPTVGFTALYAALISECNELFITGFTFFKTPYAQGYRDHLVDLEENKKHFKKQGIHDAGLEFILFKKFLKESRCETVKLDNKLDAILAND